MKATPNRSGPPSAAPAAKLDPLRQSLQDVDCFVQGTAHRIGAICRSAQARLAPEKRALGDVHELLEAVRAELEELANLVNCEAENHQAHYEGAAWPALEARFAFATEASHG